MADTNVNIKVSTSGQQSLDRLDKSLNKANKSSRLLAGALGKLGAAFAGLTLTSNFFKGFAEADKARAAVRSLGVDVGQLESELRRVSVESGNLASTTQLLAASYDVASAGFGDAADNAKVLEASLQGAVGGMSDIATVSDAVTSVLNAYGLSADKAGKLVDGFIQTQNDGKIVVNQYAQQIGRLAPIAAAAGVSIEEVNAAVSAVTATGVSAESTFAGLRQGIAAILKPTSEAKKLAEELGIGFDAQSLKAKGLGGVLQDVIDKTGGSQAQMTKLFGSVEALTALLPLTNDNLETYNDNLDKQKTKTGQAEKATEDLGGTVTSQISRIVNGIGNVARVLDTVLGPALQRILGAINGIITQATKALALLADVNLGGAALNLAGAGFDGGLKKVLPGLNFEKQQVEKLASGLGKIDVAALKTNDQLLRARKLIEGFRIEATKIGPNSPWAGQAVEVQGLANNLLKAVTAQEKLIAKAGETGTTPTPTPTPIPVPTFDPTGTGTGSGSASQAADEAQRQAEAIADALKSSQDELAVAAQRLKVSQAATDLLADEEKLNLRKLEINQRFDALAKDALSTQQKQNIELTRELELRRASLDAQKGMMDSAQGEFNNFFKQQPEYAGLFNDELTKTEQLLKGSYEIISNGLVNGIKGLIDGTKDWKDILSDVASQLGQMLLQFGMKMLGVGIGIPGFADGGILPSNGPAIVGENGPELAVSSGGQTRIYSNEQSQAAMQRYSPANEQMAPAAMPSTFKLETVTINNVQYATLEQVEAMGRSASAQGAKQGEQRAMVRLRNSRSTRNNLGF